ncbi:MAG TPA: FecR domain-containing protein, partial [Actinomycetota bacterium]
EQGSGNTFSRVVHLTSSESRFEVNTPTATASVRGTEFAIRLRPDGGSDVWVVKGAVAALLPDGSSVRITAGHGLTVMPDGSHDDVYVLTAEMLAEDWLAYNLCELDDASTCTEQVLGIEITNPGKPVAEEATGGTVVLAGTTTTTSSNGGGGNGPGGDPAPQPQPTDPPTTPPPPPPPPDPPPTTPPPDQRHGCEVSQSHGQGNQNPSCGPDGPGGGNGKGNGPKN